MRPAMLHALTPCECCKLLTPEVESDSMITLGIETSGLDGSIAIVRDDVCLAETLLNQTGRRHAQSLVMEIGEALRACGLTTQDVNLVAVSHGPGSFTGLRVGMVCAKTFAYATRCQFVAVDTFAAIAAELPAGLNQVIVIEDAQKSDLFVGDFQLTDAARWQPTRPIQIESVADFLVNRADAEAVIGPGLKKLLTQPGTERWQHFAGKHRPKASVIALLGQQSLKSGSLKQDSALTDFWRASPFYLRLSSAEEKRLAMDNELPK